jgi:hypothetical protein
LEFVVDHDAPPGDLIPALAAFLLDLAEKRWVQPHGTETTG